MNEWKIIQAQANYMKVTWLYFFGSEYWGKYKVVNNCSTDGKDLNTLVANTVAKEIKVEKKFKGKPNDNSDTDKNSKNFNL